VIAAARRKPDALQVADAAVGAHHQHAFADGKLLEAFFIFEGDVIAEHEHIQSLFQRLFRLRRGVLAGERDLHEVIGVFIEVDILDVIVGLAAGCGILVVKQILTQRQRRVRGSFVGCDDGDDKVVRADIRRDIKAKPFQYLSVCRRHHAGVAVFDAVRFLDAVGHRHEGDRVHVSVSFDYKFTCHTNRLWFPNLY